MLHKTHALAVRTVCFSDRSVSVGMAQTSGALESEAVSDVKSSVTAFFSDPPKKIKLLIADEGLILPVKHSSVLWRE